MLKNIFITTVLLLSFNAFAQESINDTSENYFTENDSVKRLKEVVVVSKNNPTKASVSRT